MSVAQREDECGEPRVLTWEGTGQLPAIPDKNFAVFMLEEMAKAQGDAVAVVDAETGHQRTYSELCGLVPRVSGGLAAAGVEQGHRVVVYTFSHTDYPLLFLSILHRGATIVPISPVHEMATEELLYALRLVEPQWAVVHNSMLDQAEAAFAQLPPGSLRKVWVLGSAEGRPNITDLMECDPLPAVTKEDGLDPSQAVAHIPLSSGTTGPRKGVLLSHRCEVVKMMMIKHHVNMPERSHLRTAHATCLLVQPLAHGYGQIYLFNTLIFGGTAVILSKFDVGKCLEAIEKYQVRMTAMVPYHLQLLVATPLLSQHNLTSLQIITSAGAMLTTVLATALTKKLNVTLYNLWGMTEITSICSDCAVTEHYTDGCIGKLVPYFELKVVDTRDGQMVGAGVPGELCLRGPSTLLGYIMSSTTTSSFKDSEGWIRTGDYGYFDHSNNIFLTDRIKELIKVKAMQVQPFDLQRLLLKHSSVEEAVVVGVADDTLGEVPRAYVVLRPEASTNPSLLQQYVDEQVSDLKRLRGGVWVVESIPKNPTGKVVRHQLQSGTVTPLAFC